MEWEQNPCIAVLGLCVYMSSVSFFSLFIEMKLATSQRKEDWIAELPLEKELPNQKHLCWTLCECVIHLYTVKPTEICLFIFLFLL